MVARGLKWRERRLHLAVHQCCLHASLEVLLQNICKYGQVSRLSLENSSSNTAAGSSRVRPPKPQSWLQYSVLSDLAPCADVRFPISEMGVATYLSVDCGIKTLSAEQGLA